MKCPVCRSISLESTELETGLRSYHCGGCNGNWIRFQDYDEWKRNHTEFEIKPPLPGQCGLEYDFKKPCLCPDCGAIIIKYKISSKIPFSIDHCSSCNGAWLDCNEWETLVQNNLYQQMNEFFTEPWQDQLKKDMTVLRFEEHYRNKFGEAEYEKLKGVREWVQASKLRSEMIAFITDEDPYKL